MNRHVYPQSRHDRVGPTSVGLGFDPTVSPDIPNQFFQSRPYFVVSVAEGAFFDFAHLRWVTFCGAVEFSMSTWARCAV